MVDRDGVIAKTKDTVEPMAIEFRKQWGNSQHSLSKGEGETRLLSSLSEVQVLDRKVTDSQDVPRHEALHRARAILDGELGTVRLVRRRSGRVILGVEEACNGRALGARHPEVARPGVQNDLELNRSEQ